jgi:CheY-like chemotaxis protein
MKILIIEDNPANMKLVLNILEMAGYTALQAFNAESGIAIAKEETPDLILMDIILSDMDGITASRILKSSRKTGNIPVIAMTSLAMSEDEEKIKEAGFDRYISKPFDYKEFLDIVKTYSEDMT